MEDNYLANWIQVPIRKLLFDCKY